MNRNTHVMAAVESLEQRLTDFLQQIETLAGTSASQQSEFTEAAGFHRQLLERLDQVVLAGSPSTGVNGPERAAQEEIRDLSEMLERKFNHVTETNGELELFVQTCQEQLDRIEGRLETLHSASQEAARFG